MTPADKLRELLATRPAMPNVEELTRWWRESGRLVPELLEQWRAQGAELAEMAMLRRDAQLQVMDRGASYQAVAAELAQRTEELGAWKLAAKQAQAIDEERSGRATTPDDILRLVGVLRAWLDERDREIAKLRSDLEGLDSDLVATRAALRREQDARAELRLELDRERLQHRASIGELHDQLERTQLLRALTLCVECGPDVAIDEDGCCVTCGGGATGAWLRAQRERMEAGHA